jgi:guanidinopropionase
VGADVVEVSPSYDAGGLTSMAAGTVVYEVLCLLVNARERRLQGKK